MAHCENKLLPEEIIAGLLNLGGFSDFPASQKIHRYVYKLKKNSKFAEMLEVFRFVGSPVAPFSDVLDQTFFNLQFSNKLKRSNPELVNYSITPDLVGYYKAQVEPKLSGDDKALLKNMSLEIEGFLSGN